ncbi:MAG: hypothetical protein JOY64_24125 [Alphaproteobacteria bacterium]|nr:hypothetical protein [Alphaproteobacteria bacterium]MBV8410736.1 hypothetical protein [Alphaproteobacteria bacterium]
MAFLLTFMFDGMFDPCWAPRKPADTPHPLRMKLAQLPRARSFTAS